MDRRLEDGQPPEIVTTDVVGNVLRVGVPGWTPETSLDDEPVVGRADGLRLPPVPVMVTIDGEIRHKVATGSESYTTTGPVTLNVDAPLRTEVTVPDGQVRIERSDDAVHVRLPDGCRVEFTFRSRVDDETPAVVVPPTADGLATALSTVHLPITERSPDRTWPSLRPQTASVSLGERSAVPFSVESAPVEITAPPTPDALLPLAPLAAYLRASVTVERGTAVRITTSETTWRIDPPADRDGDERRAYERTVQDHLRRVFWLDCLAREAGGAANEHQRSDVLDDHGLSADRLYDASIPERLTAYEAVSPTEVRETFPAWHYAISVPPTVEAVELIGHRLHQLPLVHVADDAASVDVRAEPRGGAPELIEPRATPARTHAWASDGVPVGGWKLLDADESRESARSGGDPLRFVVVVNDGASADEYVAASDHYERREDLNVAVRTERNLQSAELARVLEGETDLVHVVGHHDEDGLVCPDGSLGPDQLGSTGVRTFFFNACGSYAIGRRLIERGAEAGVVTTMAVLDETAATVGRRWSRLLAEGWPVVTALDRARSTLGAIARNHTVVGDGTVVLTQSDALLPPVTSVTRIGVDRWRVELLYDHPIYHGIQGTHLRDDDWFLPGDGCVYEFDTARLEEFLDSADSPVTVDGEFYWPEQRAWLDDG